MEMMTESNNMYYQKHIVFCVNQRQNKQCCNNNDAEGCYQFFKKRLKTLGLKGKGLCHVSCSSCLGRCSEGPIMVIYPDVAWYTYDNQDDLERIIQNHIMGDVIVDDLLLPGSVTFPNEYTNRQGD